MARSLRQFVLLPMILSLIGMPARAGDRGPASADLQAPWTLASALSQLALYPHDAYLQYVALQLARRDGPSQMQDVARLIQRQRGRMARRSRAGRREQIDLFNLTTGALAVQESLQLDAMTGGVQGNVPDLSRSSGRRRNIIYRGSPAVSADLRRLGRAMHNYHDTHRSFPAAATYDSKGRPLLSWRVHLLPFLGQRNLYRQFHIDEPWDSLHNRALIARMPDVYRVPGDVPADEAATRHKTRYLVPVGKATLFPGRKPVRMADVRDGTSNTIMIVQAAEERAVVWTKPEDLRFDPEKPTAGLARAKPAWFHVVMADGSVRSLPTTADPEILRYLFIRNDGKPINWNAVLSHVPPISAQRELASINIATLTGPTVRSHPFEQMLAGRRPAVSQLAAAVPEDFYFVRFRSLGKLLELANRSDLWATHLFSQSTQDAYSHQVDSRLKTQLCIETSPLLRPFYDLVVHEVAVTGSDLFLREGSDVTLLFRYQQEDVFKMRMDGFLANAAKAHPEIRRTTGSYRGVPFVHLASPDRRVCVFSAYPGNDLHIRSNSRVAFERVIDTLQGPGGGKSETNGPKPLAKALDFVYLRTLYEKDAAEEDGFIYLSDAFIRHLVGPSTKITERRRVLCYNHLRMLGHAALLYRTEHGKAPESVQQLIKSKCLPADFRSGRLTCADGGHYRLSADGMAGACSVHGRAGWLTPCCEIPVQRITSTERDLYQRFLQDYNRYWRTYFDPIGIRVQLTAHSYRLETVVLPLIDNSIYTAMAQVFGGTPGPLDSLPVPNRTILSMALKLDKEKLIAADAEVTRQRKRMKRFNHLKQIALAFHNHHSTFKRFPPRGDRGAKLSWRVHLLPFLDLDPLYRRFRLDEPWDSPHNKKLLKEMPTVYGPTGTTTRIVGFAGEGAPFGKPEGLAIRNITDGTSNTILVVQAGPDKAVPWTKPADLPFDPTNPGAALGTIPDEGFPAVLMDGSVRMLPKNIDAATLKALVTYRGGERASRPDRARVRRRPRPLVDARAIEHLLRELGVQEKDAETLGVSEFLQKGIGDQISFHMYDAEPTFAFSAPRFLGMALGGPRRGFGSELLFAVPLVSSLNAPVYLAVPVADARIVDRFLGRLDRVLARVSRRPFGGGFFSVKTDFYHLPTAGRTVRCFAWEFFSFRFRFFVARIDDVLYIATQPFILEDLAKLASAGPQAKTSTPADSVAHVLVRIRPENWRQVLADYRLGWAEANRESCLKNLGPLLGVARAYKGTDRQIFDMAGALYGVRYYCPDGGHYEVVRPKESDREGPSHVRCSVHGSAEAPRQAAAPAKNGQLDRLLAEFTGLTAALTFTKEGLRAVLRIDRKPAQP